MATGLRTLRERAGLTQQALAAAAGISQAAVSSYESGRRRNPTGAQLSALARALGTTTDEVLTAIQGEQPIPDSVLVPDNDPDFQRHVDDAEAWDQPLVREWLRSVVARKRRREQRDCPDCPPARIAEERETYSA